MNINTNSTKQKDFNNDSLNLSETSYHKKRVERDLLDKNLYSYKDTFRCLFCGGKDCKNENYLLHPTKSPAIVGLNSDLVDENIFASQRPSNILIEKYNLISQFQEKNIGLIINVQRPGEHPSCGPNEGLDFESGFSYSPSKFEIEGIHVKLCGWKDMDVPDSLYFMLDIVKEMFWYIYFLKKKVLVHCHSGYGRTGIVIVCYKIFSECVNADFAIKEIRLKRKKCIQNKDQYEYCVKFYLFIMKLRENFGEEKKLIDIILKYQNDLNVNNYKFNYFQYNSSVPIFLQYALDAILDIKKRNNIPITSLYNSLNGTIEIKENSNEYLEPIIENINIGKWNILKSCDNIIIISELIYKWLNTSVEYCISPKNILKVKKDLSNIDKCLKRYELEIISYFCNFFNALLIENENIIDEEFKLMIGKLSIYLLGFNINDVKNDYKFKQYSETLISIFIKGLNKKENLIPSLSENSNDMEENQNEKKIKQIHELISNYLENKTGNLTNDLETSQKTLNSIRTIVNVFNEQNLKSSSKISINDEKEKFKRSVLESIFSEKEITDNKNIASEEERTVNNLNLNFNLNSKNQNNDNIFKENHINEQKINLRTPWIKEEDC